MRASSGELSSRGTFFYKFLFPVIWIAVFGPAVYEASQSAVQRGSIDRPLALSMAVAWVLATIFILYSTVPLLRVELRDGRLYASNYRREIEIRHTDIERETQNAWSNVRPITLHLRNETPLGTRIRFMPPSREILAFWKEDPVVETLRELAALPPLQPSTSMHGGTRHI